MAKMTYQEQLQHPNWQRKRLEVLEANDYQCSSCGDKETMLHVHHKRYVKGRLAWEYELGELACLCKNCHEKEHSIKDLFERVLADLPPDVLNAVLRVTTGYLMGNLWLSAEVGHEVIEVGQGQDAHLEIGMAAAALFRSDGTPWRQVMVDATKARKLSPVLNHYASTWEEAAGK